MKNLKKNSFHDSKHDNHHQIKYIKRSHSFNKEEKLVQIPKHIRIEDFFIINDGGSDSADY